MKKQLLFSLLGLAALLLAATAATAQRRIDLRHNGASSLFTEFQPALDAAVNGDTIYLPGTTFTGYFDINKKLAIIGVGINPDSTASTNKTQFFNTISFSSGSSGSFITGVKFGQLYIFGGAENIRIQKCAGDIHQGVNCIISECASGVIKNQSNSQIFNNIVLGAILDQSNGFIKNNVVNNFIGGWNNCLVENNLIRNYKNRFKINK